MSISTYYTIDEASRMLKVHPQTLRRWIRQGTLPATRFGSQLRLRPEDLQRAGQPASSCDAGEIGDFDRLALASLAALWDNEEDAVYDDWKQLYGVEER